MSLEDVIDLIQTWIIENGNEEITADVLRPILEAMVNQPNDLIGDLDDLDTTDRTNLVAAINEVKSIADNNSGLVIHYGATTPLVTPPASFGLGDFFAQVISPSTAIVSFWQYNGVEWVKIEPNKIKTVFRNVSLIGIATNRPSVEWAKDAINQAIATYGNYTCNQGELITFVFNLASSFTTSGGTPTVLRRLFFRLNSGTTVCSSIGNAYTELMPDGSDTFQIPSELLIDLGDIGSSDVEDAFNVDVNQPFEMTDEKFVQATQDGVLKLWQWRGGDGTFGSSGTLATADDFLDLTAQPTVPSEVSKLFYEDIAAMIADQENQSLQNDLCVKDASDDPNITFGVGETKLQAFYRWTGTTDEDIDDYELMSAPYSENGGGGTVESVTGDNGNVDNTDANNPIVLSKPLVTVDTEADIVLYPFGNFCNSYVANLEKAFVFSLTNPATPAGESATVIIKTETGDLDFPTLEDADGNPAEYIEGAPFEEEAYYDLYAWHNNAIVAYTFLRRSAPPPWEIIPDDLGDGSIRDWIKINSNPIIGFGTLSLADGSYGAPNGGAFGLLKTSDIPFSKWALEFVIDRVQSGGELRFLVATSGVGTFLISSVYLSYFSGSLTIKNSSFVTQDTATVSIGDTVRIVCEIGKVEIFVNGVSSAEWVDGSITWDVAYSSIDSNKGYDISGIKEIIWLD
jgi:hypothetical protein